MKYKYYACFQINEKHEYCSRRYIKIPANLNIDEYLNEFEEKNEITKTEYDKQVHFYQVEVKI